jgi:DNA repair exonuclease SbcCD nuclease subunit
LIRIAECGIPVLLVPGNHERSQIPVSLLESNDKLHIFDRPRTYRFFIKGITVAMAGFPYLRRGIGERFGEIVRKTGVTGVDADVSLLCMHQCVEGARVGLHEYTFRPGTDVIPGRRIPALFAAILSGHIHRYQVVCRDLQNLPIAAPVVYAGSTERTSFAEQKETKGYVIVRITTGSGDRSPAVAWDFHPLETRPMCELNIATAGKRRSEILAVLKRGLSGLHPDSIVRIRADDFEGFPAADELRSITPVTMNLVMSNTYRRKYDEHHT